MMDVFTLILCVFWSIAGLWLIVGELPGMVKHRIPMIFGIENRWGKMLVGVGLLGVVGKQIHTWYIDPNSSWEILLAPMRLYYSGFSWF